MMRTNGLHERDYQRGGDLPKYGFSYLVVGVTVIATLITLGAFALSWLKP